MERPTAVPYGKKVRLVYDFVDERWPRFSVGDKIDLGTGSVTRVAPDPPPVFVPIGTIGVVAEGPYSSGIFDYSRECPVQFEGNGDWPKTLGTPWEFLELIK